MSSNVESNIRPDYDQVIQQIADYALGYIVDSEEALDTARYCLMDTLGCGLLALQFPECAKHLGPLVSGTVVPHGARVPGTSYRLDPVKAAWDIGCIIRWLDYNDTWLAAEWGHPSDNLGGILAVTDHLSQKCIENGGPPFLMRDLLEAMIKAHEIQGILALENSFNRVGLDHVLLVRVASTAIVTALMGGNREQVMAALSHAFVDGSSLRTYRHAPNAGSRKSWAAGDATSRAVRLADIAMRGEMGVPGALTAKQWGFYDVCFSKTNVDQKVKPVEERVFRLSQELGTYVMENVLFKISYPAEFHAQTAIEAAMKLRPALRNRLDLVETIRIKTHESAIRIISKSGSLANAADRDHCIQYMVAVALACGELTAESYGDSFHQKHPILDELREKMLISEDPRFSREYLDSDKRSIANAIKIEFSDGSATDEVTVEYPVGHRRRRAEGIPLLLSKFERNLASCFGVRRCHEIADLCSDHRRLEAMAVNDFVQLFVV